MIICILEGMQKNTHIHVNYDKVREITQGPAENPAKNYLGTPRRGSPEVYQPTYHHPCWDTLPSILHSILIQLSSTFSSLASPPLTSDASFDN